MVVLLARRDRLRGGLAGELGHGQPAVTSVYEILSDGLRERALFVLVIGLRFIAGGAARRGQPPFRRRTALPGAVPARPPVAVYAVVGVVFLLWLNCAGIDNVGQVLVLVALAVLAVVGVEVLRRQTARSSRQPDGFLTAGALRFAGSPRCA